VLAALVAPHGVATGWFRLDGVADLFVALSGVVGLANPDRGRRFFWGVGVAVLAALCVVPEVRLGLLGLAFLLVAPEESAAVRAGLVVGLGLAATPTDVGLVWWGVALVVLTRVFSGGGAIEAILSGILLVRGMTPDGAADWHGGVVLCGVGTLAGIWLGWRAVFRRMDGSGGAVLASVLVLGGMIVATRGLEYGPSAVLAADGLVLLLLGRAIPVSGVLALAPPGLMFSALWLAVHAALCLPGGGGMVAPAVGLTCVLGGLALLGCARGEGGWRGWAAYGVISAFPGVVLWVFSVGRDFIAGMQGAGLSGVWSVRDGQGGALYPFALMLLVGSGAVVARVLMVRLGVTVGGPEGWPGMRYEVPRLLRPVLAGLARLRLWRRRVGPVYGEVRRFAPDRVLPAHALLLWLAVLAVGLCVCAWWPA